MCIGDTCSSGPHMMDESDESEAADCDRVWARRWVVVGTGGVGRGNEMLIDEGDRGGRPAAVEAERVGERRGLAEGARGAGNDLCEGDLGGGGGCCSET